MANDLNQRVLITGASGFIGQSLYRAIAERFDTWALCRNPYREDGRLFDIDLTDQASIMSVCRLICPDVVIHCAGLAHQRFGAISRRDYFRVNAMATETLAKAAAASNPEVHFIFLSSVSVYGEPGMTLIDELSPCRPAGPYAESKLEAEKRLLALHAAGVLKRLDILRLAPVYDREWTFNLDRRVMAPKGLAYLRFGCGYQLISALARPNLEGFVLYLLAQGLVDRAPVLRLLNVCDAEAYSFNRIIAGFMACDLKPSRPVIPFVLWPVKLMTNVAAELDHERADWWRACYAKLADDLVFDNSRMLATGFVPPHSLETILDCKPGRPPFV